MFKNILVGIDLVDPERLMDGKLTESNEKAVQRALDIAAQTSGKLTFLAASTFKASALHLLNEETAVSEKEFLKELAQKQLDILKTRAEERNVPSEGKLVEGKGWFEMINEVNASKSDLVIIGSRNRSQTSRFIFGSTGIKLIRNCPCPVWVIKPGQKADVMSIMVADDFTDVSANALEMGVELARLLDARLHVVNAVRVPHERTMKRGGMTEQRMLDFKKEIQDQAAEKMNSRLSMTDYRTVEQGVKTHVIQGVPDAVVTSMIETEEIDLLVMGTIARSGLNGLLVGNCAERILPDIDCSLLAIKPDDFQSPAL